MTQAPASGGGMKPHRGTLVLVMGILGIVCNGCFVFGIIAWIFGKNDLAEMDAGTMDPEGRGLTNAGKICGMVGVGLGVLAWVVNIIWGVLMGGLAAMN